MRRGENTYFTYYSLLYALFFLFFDDVVRNGTNGGERVFPGHVMALQVGHEHKGTSESISLAGLHEHGAPGNIFRYAGRKTCHVFEPEMLLWNKDVLFQKVRSIFRKSSM